MLRFTVGKFSIIFLISFMKAKSVVFTGFLFTSKRSQTKIYSIFYLFKYFLVMAIAITTFPVLPQVSFCNLVFVTLSVSVYRKIDDVLESSRVN